MPYLPQNFGLLEADDADYDRARAVVLPVPFERTVSYGHGTAAGPDAILAASRSMELYDEELRAEPYGMGIATLPPFLPEAFDMGEALAEIQAEARRHLEAGKFLVTLGGEHSLTTAPARAARQVVEAAGDGSESASQDPALRDPGLRPALRAGRSLKENGTRGRLGIVQFDAHADLRDEFDGTPYSHASVMRRLVEDGLPTVAVGIRSLSAPEGELIAERNLPVIWGSELGRSDAGERFVEMLNALPETVYLTFDVDYFDPALLPATGTPEPGGGHWWPTLALLRELFRRKTVVAMDLVELAPTPHHHASDFLCAKLVYKCLGYLWESEGR